MSHEQTLLLLKGRENTIQKNDLELSSDTNTVMWPHKLSYCKKRGKIPYRNELEHFSDTNTVTWPVPQKARENTIWKLQKAWEKPQKARENTIQKPQKERENTICKKSGKIPYGNRKKSGKIPYGKRAGKYHMEKERENTIIHPGGTWLSPAHTSSAAHCGTWLDSALLYGCG